MPGSTTLDVVNSIFWDNTDAYGPTDVEHAQIDSAGTVNVHYSFIHELDDYQDGASTNIGEFGTNPGFIDEDGADANEFDSEDNFRLYVDSMDTSPCIDTGNNDDVPCDEFDVDEDDIECDPFDPDENEYTPDLDLRERVVDGDLVSTADVDMGAYEAQSCIWDLNDDCKVNTVDLLLLFAEWGTDPGGPPDFNDDDIVNISDLLILFANWGPCYCAPFGTIVLSFEDELDEACISEAEWDDYEDIMQNGTEEEKENYQCWMLHWIEDCDKCTCIGESGCPGDDPFGG